MLCEKSDRKIREVRDKRERKLVVVGLPERGMLLEPKGKWLRDRGISVWDTSGYICKIPIKSGLPPKT